MDARQGRDGRQIPVDDDVDKRCGRLLAVNQQLRADHIGAGLAGQPGEGAWREQIARHDHARARRFQAHRGHGIRQSRLRGGDERGGRWLRARFART